MKFQRVHEGGTVAEFAGSHVHKRLITEEAYREKRYEDSLKRAFLGTDGDLRAGQSQWRTNILHLNVNLS